jgi:hypothetical protein
LARWLPKSPNPLAMQTQGVEDEIRAFFQRNGEVETMPSSSLGDLRWTPLPGASAVGVLPACLPRDTLK